MPVFVPLFQSLSKGNGEYKLLVVFATRADFQQKEAVRELMV
jgi:hypothetical protein